MLTTSRLENVVRVVVAKVRRQDCHSSRKHYPPYGASAKRGYSRRYQCSFAARVLALKEYEIERKSREQQHLEFIKISLAPRLYDTDLRQTLESRCRNTCEWILDESLIKDWESLDKDAVPILWLTGIPGAGDYLLK